MWKVVFIAATKSEALSIEQKLTEKGFLIKINSDSGEYQIKVPESEAEEVYEHLINL